MQYIIYYVNYFHLILCLFLFFPAKWILSLLHITLHNVCVAHRGMFRTLGRIMSSVGDIMSTWGKGCSVHRRNIMSTPWILWLMWGRSSIKPLNLHRNLGVLNISLFTHDIPDVLSILWCTQGIPLVLSCFLSGVLNTPWCSHDISHYTHDISQCISQTLCRMHLRMFNTTLNLLFLN